MYGPLCGEGFAEGKDFFDDNINIFGPCTRFRVGSLLKSAKVSDRIAQTIDMINTKSCNHPLGSEAEHHRVNRLEGHWVFHSQADQITDGEEAAIVDLLICGLPKGECVRLVRQELVEEEERRGDTFSAIEEPNISVYKPPDLRRTCVEGPESLLYSFTVLPPLAGSFGRRDSGRRYLRDSGLNSLKLQPSRSFRAERSFQAVLPVSEQTSVRTSRDR